MKLSRIAAGLLCLTLLLGVLPLTLPASNSTASAATEVRGGSFGNPLPMKLDRRATGKISADLTVVYYEVSVPGHGQYKLESGGGLQVKAKLYRQDQSWVKTFTPDGGENGKQIESEFTISKKGKYFLAVEAASAKKTGSFTITLSAAKGAAPAATPKPTEAPVTPAPATSAPDTQAPGDRTLAVPAIKSVVQYHLQAVKVQWNAVAGAAGYGLYKSTSANGTYSLVRYVTGTETTASYLAEGTQYFFRVRAYANAGSAKSFGGYSPYKAVWVLAKPKLSAFQSSPNAARLTWPKVNEAAGYTVYRSRSLTGTYSVIGSTTSATFYTDANLAPGAYYYKVAAYRMNGAVKLYGPMSVARLVSIKTSWVPTPTPPPTQPPQTAMPPSTTDPAQPTPVPTATPTQPPASATVTYRALLVGNSNYAGSVSDLAAGPDLSAMSGLLSKLNMSGKTYKITTRADLSASGITSAISSAFSGADDDDISLFYYSGHGVTDTGTYAGALVGVDISYLTTAQLASALSKVPGTVIVILDSCGSGAVIQSKNATGAATAQEAVSQNPAAFNSAVLSAFSGFTAKSAEMATGSKFKVITACSIATSTWQNANGGFFTQGIARAGALNGSFMNADNDKNGTVTQSEAYSYARSYSKSVNDSSGVIPEWDMQVQSYPSGSAFPFFQR